MKRLKKLVILIPCHNEEQGIAKVLADIPKKQLLQIGIKTMVIVINNHSTDKTEQVARAYKANVVNEPKLGKGNAMKRAFAEVPKDADYVVMIDGDNTYKTKEVLRMVEPLMNDFCDVVVGSRLGGKLMQNSFTRRNRIANWFYTFFVRFYYVANVTDVLSGYFSFKREVITQLINHIESDGFAIEMEMITKIVKMGFSIYSVPITYDKRIGVSKLSPYSDGWKILVMLMKNRAWKPKTAKRIAFVSDAVYPFNKGGKETRLYELSTRLAKKGYDVHIYTMHWWRTPSPAEEEGRGGVTNPSGLKLKIDGVTYHAISPYYPLYSGERRSIKEAILFGLHCFKMLFKSFDVVEVDSMPYIPLYVMKIVCLLKGKPLYATWHEVWEKDYWVSYAGYKGVLAYYIEKISSFLPDTIISVSKKTTESIQKTYVRKKGIVTIENGIDSAYIATIPKAKKSYHVIFVGRLLEHKHVEVLLDAIHLLKKKGKKITAAIIGTGPEEKKLQSFVKKNTLTAQIDFYPHLPDYKDVLSFMKASKVLVLPSTREGFGLVVLEAHTCGIPVITTDDAQNAAKHLINHGKNGYILPLNAEVFTNTIIKSLTQDWNVSYIKKSLLHNEWSSLVLKVEKIYAKK